MNTLILTKQEKQVKVVVNPLLNNINAYGYTIISNHIYYTSKSEIVYMILTRLYNRGYKDK